MIDNTARSNSWPTLKCLDRRLNKGTALCTLLSAVEGCHYHNYYPPQDISIG